MLKHFRAAFLVMAALMLGTGSVVSSGASYLCLIDQIGQYPAADGCCGSEPCSHDCCVTVPGEETECPVPEGRTELQVPILCELPTIDQEVLAPESDDFAAALSSPDPPPESGRCLLVHVGRFPI